MSIQSLSLTINKWVLTNLRGELLDEETKLDWKALKDLKPYKSNWTKAVKICGIALTPEEHLDLLEELVKTDLEGIHCEAWGPVLEALTEDARVVRQQVDIISHTPAKSKIRVDVEEVSAPTKLFEKVRGADVGGFDDGDAQAAVKGFTLRKPEVKLPTQNPVQPLLEFYMEIKDAADLLAVKDEDFKKDVQAEFECGVQGVLPFLSQGKLQEKLQ